MIKIRASVNCTGCGKEIEVENPAVGAQYWCSRSKKPIVISPNTGFYSPCSMCPHNYVKVGTVTVGFALPDNKPPEPIGKMTCPNCNGTKALNGHECRRCEGTGQVNIYR